MLDISNLFEKTLASAPDATATLSLPVWVLWGIGVALALTFSLLAFVSLLAGAFTTISGGWQGGSEPWKDFRATFKGFLFYGLPAGLVSSYVWSHGHPWIGVLSGLAVIATTGIIWARIEKRKRPY